LCHYPVWGVEYTGAARALDRLIVNLRWKIEAVPAEPRHFLTFHGRGCWLDG
jgi:DNA-binding response OmpR family regulator